MCGIAGLWDETAGTHPEELTRLARTMADRLGHRGPDEGNVWIDAEAGLGLGHRRLAIQDVSPAGRQPMLSASGRTVLCYNGETYDSDELRAALDSRGIAWRGHSDTEAMLEAFEALGLVPVLGRLTGKFAFALWDRRQRTLTLVRDRIGIKPLYWTRRNGLVLFGSELKALLAHPGFEPRLDRDALAAYLRHSYYPHPHTALAGVQQIEPGHLVRFAAGREPMIEAWWTLADVVGRARAEPFVGTETEAVDALEQLLRDAVRRRMISDVPLGAFLSGGYDSSTVVALMQAQSSRPVQTFSIGFREDAYDEAKQARAVARHLGTDHTEHYVSPEEALEVVPRLPEMYDEPFGDSSQIPTFLVSRLARGRVTVALSGDGGDELFTGYNRYAEAARFRRYLAPWPRPARALGAAAVHSLSPAAWDGAFRVVPERYRPRLAGDKLHKLADVAAETGDGFYHKLTSLWQDPLLLVPGAREPSTLVTDERVKTIVPDFIERMQYRDTLTYLPDDILTKVDRASMAVALEARVPLLDHRVVELAWRLPMHLKLRNGVRKWALRQVLYRHVPPALVDRPKMGFGVPIDAWLRGPLRAWAEDLLSERSLAEGGLLAPAPIRKRWQEHLSGRRNWQHCLWSVLMLEAWRRHWRIA